MNLSTCQKDLNTVLAKNSSQNISQITELAWGKNRDACITTFGGWNKVNTYIQTVDRNNLSSYIPVETTEPTTQATVSTPSMAGIMNIEMSTATTFVKDVGILLLLLFSAFLLYKIIRYCAIFFYDIWNAHRIVYLRVLQTRGDSKVDREANKELAKDMKEKISRMSQVYNNMYSLGEASFYESILSFLVKKPKVSLVISYEDGKVEFIVGVYPEFRAIVEGAISAQFSESSIEICDKPRFFRKKYSDLSVLEPEKDVVYTIKNFKYMPDDPLNNLVDAVAKVSPDDTFHILMVLKPEDDKYNKRVKDFADALFRKQDSKIKKTPWWHYIIMPWKILAFFVHGPSKEFLKKGKEEAGGMVRMIKSEEDAYQSMGEEAANHAFATGLVLLTSSDTKGHTTTNLQNVTSAYGVYSEQYLNEIKESNVKKDIFGRFFKPMRRFAVRFKLLHFFSTSHVFSVNALSSLFHFPDGMYNRTAVIRWMEYKALPAPGKLPVMNPADDTGYVMSGVVAESYMGGKMDTILRTFTDPAIGKRIQTDDVFIPIEQYKQDDLADKEIIEKDEKKFVKTSQEKELYGYKINRGGVLLGVNIYRNRYTPIYMKREDRMRHHYMIGKSGTGKSVLLQTLARQDIWNGDGCCVIDPHGDLVEDILEYIPKERAKDVVFFDAGNEDRPMGLNLYDIDSVDKADRIVNDATEIFIKMFGSEIFGPRIQEYFKYGSLTLLEDLEDKPTLLDVPRLFTDETYREFKTKKVKNAVVRNFREKTYAAMGDREKQEIIPYFTSKFVSFNTNRLIRNIIGQTQTAIQFREAMDSQKIILVSLSKGKIGEINAQLLGMIIVSQLYNGAMGRANTAKEDRKDFFLYVDEFQNFVSGTFADILSEARKYRLGLIMAHQYIAQLESGDKAAGGKADVKAAVFGNAGTIQSFKIGAPDAEFLEKEYAPVLGAQDIIGIANYKTYCKLNVDNTTSRVFSMNAIYSQDYRNKRIGSILKEYSAKKYGRKREFVDAEISARLGITLDEDITIPIEDTMNGSSSETPETVATETQV